jgi:hypothetical protein
MVKFYPSCLKKAYLFFCVLTISLSAMSQNLYVHPLPQELIRIDVKYLRPYFTRNANIEMKDRSGMYEIFMNIPFIKKFNLYFDVPIIIQAYDNQTHGNGIGNVYLGLHSRPDSLDNIYTSTSFGIFLPTVNSSISALSFLGGYASFQEPQKAMNNTLTLYANYVYSIGERRRKYIGFEIGPQFYIPTISSAGTTDLYLHYGLSAGYTLCNVIVTSEFLGLVDLTSSYSTFSNRIDHSLALAVSFEKLDLRPTIFYQIVIDDQASQIMNGILGFNLSFIAD